MIIITSKLTDGGATLFYRGYDTNPLLFSVGRKGGPILVEAALQIKYTGTESISFDRLRFSRQYILYYLI